MSGAPLTELDWSVRGEVYATFGRTGRAPSIDELAIFADVTEPMARESLARLADGHHLALLPDGGVWMANPFSAVPTEYPVDTPKMSCWANCAWDALGVPAILGVDGWTRTQCAESGTPLEFGVRDGQVEGDDGVIHLVTPIRDAWVDIGFT